MSVDAIIVLVLLGIPVALILLGARTFVREFGEFLDQRRDEQ